MLVDIEHRSFEATLRRCADLGGVDLIFTSPPYPTEVPGAKGREGAPTRRYGGDTPGHFLWEDYQRLGDLCYRALKPGGFCIIIIDGPVRFTRSKKIGSERSLIAFKLAIDWAERVGFRYVEHEAYLRDGMPGDVSPRRRSGWEPMHVFQRPGGRGFFDCRAIMVPAISAGQRRSKRPTANMWLGKKESEISAMIYHDMRMLTTAITSAEGGATVNKEISDAEHPAPFTSWIAKVQVLSYCLPGGLACDPFVGSGTTAIAALRHGRKFVGGDLGARERDGARWADVARERALAARDEWLRSQVAAGASAPTLERQPEPAELPRREEQLRLLPP